jgi:AbrB family looped-hinge helix DNA binding protein
MYTVSITSQGQISIPAKVRKELGFDKRTKAIITVEGDKMVVEPAPDFMSLKGSLHKYAKKGMPIEEIIRLEKEAVGEAVVERYLAKEKRSGNKLLKIKP